MNEEQASIAQRIALDSIFCELRKTRCRLFVRHEYEALFEGVDIQWWANHWYGPFAAIDIADVRGRDEVALIYRERTLDSPEVIASVQEQIDHRHTLMENAISQRRLKEAEKSYNTNLQ